MVIGLLTLTAIPTVTGISLGCSEQRKQNNREDDERRMAKFYTDVECDEDSEEGDELEGKRLVLRNNKIYVDDPSPENRKIPAHAGTAFYINYPEPDHMKDLKRGLGLVATIQDDPPMLNWIFADKETCEVKYGNRTESCENVPAPWDWRDDETTIILEKQGGFYAVKQKDGSWAVYFDRNWDDLKGVLGSDAVVLPIRLKRTLAEPPKPEGEQQKQGGS